MGVLMSHEITIARNRAEAEALGADCQQCPLRVGGRFCPSSGPDRAELAFVGEAPGRQEAEKGEPFIGPSGRLLTLVNNRYGIKRDEVFLTNATLCRPADGSTPPKAAINACRNRVLNELHGRQVGTVVTLGNSAALSVLGLEGITKLRVGPGKKSPYALLDGVRVIPTVHPAACVDESTRILTAKSLAWVPAKDIKVGDELIGFDEEPVDGQRRKWRRSIVTEVGRQTSPRYKVTLINGKELICSDDHLWLTKHHGYGNYKWSTPEQLRKRVAGGYVTSLLLWMDPWDTPNTKEAGYLAGFLDGEGSMHPQDGVSWGQNDGETAEYVVRLFKEFGFNVRSSAGWTGIHKYTGNTESGNCTKYNLGGRKAGLRALGMFQPIRLLSKAAKVWEDHGYSADAIPIKSVERIDDGTVVIINTTTGTFIAEGYLSHNCLRQSDMFPSLITDVGKVNNSLPPWTEPEIDIYDNPKDAIRVLKEIGARGDIVVVDIEVDIEKDTAFDHPNRYGLLCVGLAYKKHHAVVIGENACADERVLDAMYDALEASKIVAQNGKFDLAGLHPKLGTLELYFDTMIASYVQDERPGIHGLKHMAVEILGAPQYDEDIKKYVGPRDGYGVIPRDILYRYNAYDAACTYDLYELFTRRLDATRNPKAIKRWEELYPGLEFRSLRDVHDMVVETSNELMFVELNGIAVDRKYADTLAAKYTESLGQIEREINDVLVEAGFRPINPRSPKQVQEVFAFFRVRATSTNEETLRAIHEKLEQVRYEVGTLTAKQDSFYRFVDALLVHRREAKMFGTYVKGVIKRLYRGRVYPTFLVHGTTSGRLACRNPNLQNVPRESAIKQLFIPGSPENVFVQADYSQAELRVLTWLAKDPYFRSILNDPSRDIFDELTPILYPELPHKAEVPAALWKETRIRVKAFVYGLGYGRTEFSIAKEYKLPVKEAEKVKQRFFDVIPAVVNWQAEVKKTVYKGEDLITPFGRHRRFHLITQDNWKSIQNEALSFLPQSTSSDICTRAMVRVRRELRGSGAYVRNIVHDSILVDSPRDMANDIAVMLDHHMVESAREVVGDYVDFRTEVNIGNHWGEV
jgi:uracil-DNA glycosylase family 4